MLDRRPDRFFCKPARDIRQSPKLVCGNVSQGKRNGHDGVTLVFLRPDVVRYLFVHELAHLRHMNHSPAFWRLVQTLEPDYRRLDRELLAGWRTVPLWVFGN